MGVANSFDRIAEPTVVVIGRASELEGAYPEGTRVVSLSPEDGSLEPMPVALLVLDARDHSVEVLARARFSPQLSTVPALVVASSTADEPCLALGDDAVVPPLDSTFPRRLKTLIELGRTKFAMCFAQQALDESASGLMIADRFQPDTPLVYASRAVERITGYSAAEMLGKNARMLQGPETEGAAKDLVRSALREGRRTRATLLNYRKDGAPFWNDLTIFPVRTPDGRPLRWMGGVQHDVTNVQEARAEISRLVVELLQQRHFNRAILDGVEAGIVTTDAHGRITFANRGAMRMLERDGNWIGLDVVEVLALPDSPSSLLAKHGERRWAHALRVGHRELELEVAISGAQERTEATLGFFFIFQDHTQDRQIEMERRRFERLAAMGTMVAGFAHEIRNPMASLRSLVESMNDELVDKSIALPHVGRMLKVLERVETLVRTSLLFGSPAPPQRSEHRPWTILSSAVSSLLPRTMPLGGELSIEADVDLPDVFVDEAQLVQVLIILLNNALDATGAPQRVLLRATKVRKSETTSQSEAQTFVSFEVRDDGPGIAPEIAGRIFDPFFTSKSQGLGLGLSIAQQLVNENGGRIELSSAVGGPTSFRVLVPIAP